MKLSKKTYDAKALPENYLPAAMRTRQRQEVEQTRTYSLIIPGAATEVRPISELELGQADTLGSTIGLSDNAIVYVGPEITTESAGTKYTKPEVTPASPHDGNTYVAIIDVGLVPWLTYGRHRFLRLSYLNVVGAEVDFIQPSEDGLSPQDVMQGAWDTRIAAMGRRFPGSVFSHGISAATPLHGTAMADLICGDLDSAGRVELAGLFGVELPASVLEDPSGGNLQAMMFGAIQHAIELVRACHEIRADAPKLEIVLPYGFTGGPHQFGHGFAKAANEILNAAGFEVRLHLPMGNHREERFFASLGADGFDAVTWEIPSFDRSPNTIEFAAASGDGRLSLELSSRNGRCVLELVAGEGRDILNADGQVIGSYYTNTFGEGVLRGRLCLAPTRLDDENLPTPAHGDWKLRSSDGIDLWILRDDASRLGRIGAENKQSRFFHPSYPGLGGDERADIADLDGQAPIKRRGSASILAVAMASEVADTGLRDCGAMDQTSQKPSAYSGLSMDGNSGAPFSVDLGHRGLHLVQATASGRKMRLRGTSVASALSAREAVRA